MIQQSGALRLISVVSLAIAGIVGAPSLGCAQDTAAPALPTGSAVSAPKIDPKKEQSIRALIQASGALDASKQRLTAMSTSMQRANPQIPAEFWTRVAAKMGDLAQVETRLVPIYDRHYTQQEIDDLLAFYKTPLGQKLAHETPGTVTETTSAEEDWARVNANEVSDEMVAERKKAAAAAPKSFDTKPFKGNGKPVTTKSGLKYEDMTVGTGATATAGKTAIVHYTGTLPDGTKFDSSRDRNEPFSFPLGQGRVIKGWDEGVAGMKVGGRRKLTIPSGLGYGDQGTPGGPIPPKATLIFDVELMDVR